MADAFDQSLTEQWLSQVVDPVWYRARHRDVAASGADPLRHFIDHGLNERRDPNRWFDGAWYTRRYADVAASGAHPLLHYMAAGAKQGRDPHPRFDAGWYTAQHPEAATNALLFHLRVGAARGWLTERPVAIEDYLPSARATPDPPAGIAVDVIIPVYRGLEVTRRCLESVLADSERPDGGIIVIDDRSPEPELRAWLAGLAKAGAITLLRNSKNLGFVAAVNRGIRHAGAHDVVLLNSDTEVPAGWLRRLRAQAYAAPDIASVSPLSNNATLCGYFSYAGEAMPAGMTLAAIDTACRAANTGRFAATPTTVGFCMYIRRTALDAVDLFDSKTFGKGYGEENDFCLRATALGWRHHIACDTFVYHQGGASFGAAADPAIARAYAILTERYPEYPVEIARFVADAATEPYRFAATMALLRASGLPTILLLAHEFDGGVRRHVHDVVTRDTGTANYLLLEPAARGVALSVPALPGLPRLMLAAERWRDVALVARSAGVTRVHINHLLGLDLDARALLHELAVPFDVTVHDYFAICPQVTLLPWPASSYCGEPGPHGCDACIANRASHGATDILAWRLRWAWQFRAADQVFVPSLDTLNRLRSYGMATNARLLPHEAVPSGPWPMHRPTKSGKRLRVAVLGVLANHKGAQLVASLAMAADPAQLEIQVLGDVEPDFPKAARDRVSISGRYREGELPALFAKYRPHVVWFPAPWPETYSFTLSAAIEAGLPIVASDIGAFPERLSGRPLTWLQSPTLDPAAWLSLFDTVAHKLRAREVMPPVPRPPPARARLRRGRNDATQVLVIPETFDDGSFTPCAYIRLLCPLHHPDAGAGLIATVADAGSVTRHRADVIVTQRHALASKAEADAVIAHAKRIGAALIFDIDDDLLGIPGDHPEAAELVPRAAVIEHLVRHADIVRTSTAALARRLAPLTRDVRVVGNALDERIWRAPPPRHDDYGPVRILCMGTATHDADFALILPALNELHERFGDHFELDLIGFVSGTTVPDWIRRLPPSTHAGRSYPGFVHWVRHSVGPWDIGLAPLAATRFNACKSAIKALDHAALGLATLASDVPAYQGSLADGPGGVLVANTATAWYEALSWLLRDAAARRRLAEGGAAALRETGTLASQAEAWRHAWRC